MVTGLRLATPVIWWVNPLYPLYRMAVVGCDLKSEWSAKLLRVYLIGFKGLTSIVLLKTVYWSLYYLYLWEYLLRFEWKEKSSLLIAWT